jgi:tRNA A58 N-methylase Trm61
MTVSLSKNRRQALVTFMTDLDHLSARIAHEVALQEDIYGLLRSPKSLLEIAYEKRYQDPEALRLWLNKLSAFGFLTSEPGSDLFQTPSSFPNLSTPDQTSEFTADLAIFEHMTKLLAPKIPSKLRNETGGVSLSEKPHVWDSITGLESMETLRELIIAQSQVLDSISTKLESVKTFSVLDLGAFTGNSTVTLAKRLPEDIEITTVVHSTKYVQAAEYTLDMFGITNANVVKVPPLGSLKGKIKKRFDAVFIFHQEIYGAMTRIADVAKLVHPSGTIAGFLPLRETRGQSLLLEWLWMMLQHFEKYPQQDAFRATLANSGFTQIEFLPYPLWTFSASRE